MHRYRRAESKGLFALCIFLSCAAALCVSRPCVAQSAFDVASIHPSSGDVKFERNGIIQADHGTLAMHDVTVSACIQWAYGISQGLVSGPSFLKEVHYDITAKTDPGTAPKQMRLMLQELLRERFNLAFHLEKKELRVYSLMVSRGGIKMHASSPGGEMSRQNSATGMTARSITMRELADYLSDPLGTPLTDATGLPGRYDFTLDFTPYVDMKRDDVRPDPASVLGAALKGELGLELVKAKQVMDVTVVDHVEPPTAN
jgi:uncharacterized protein (TIGR03435 family)